MRGLGAVALVCVGLVVLVGALDLVQFALMMSSEAYGTAPGALSLVLFWLPVAAAVAVGLWLIRKRHALAARWFDDSPPEITVRPRDLLRVALIVLGVVFVARAIPGLLSAVANGIRFSTEDWGGVSESQISWVWVNGLLSIIPPLAQLVVGVLLVAYSDRLAGRLWAPGDKPAVPMADPANKVCPECGAAYVPADYRAGTPDWTCDSCGGSLRPHA